MLILIVELHILTITINASQLGLEKIIELILIDCSYTTIVNFKSSQVPILSALMTHHINVVNT